MRSNPFRSARPRALHAAAAALMLAPLALSSSVTAQGGGDEIAAEPTKVGLVRFEGTYLDLPEQGGDLTTALLGGGGKPKDFYQMLGQLRDAEANAEFERILVDLSRPFVLNGPQIREVERAFASLRASGKKLVAFFESAGTGSYRLASACDEILMADMGVVDFAAPALTNIFLADAMDLFGIKMDIVRCGEFKGAVEPYMNSRMSDHLRAHYRAMLQTMNDTVATELATRRNLSKQDIRALQATRILTAQRAHDAGLVDRLVAWEGAEVAGREAMGAAPDEVEFVPVLSKKRKRRGSFNPMVEMMKLFSSKDEEVEIETPSVVVLHLSGTIVDGFKPVPGSIVSGPTVDTIRKLRGNDQAKAVVVRINSPGGSATASEAILLELKKLAAEKPVTVSMGTLAASGGYYVTCLGRPIYAEPETITGSIGVFGTKPNLGPMFRRVGLHEEVVGLDEAATMTAVAHGWTDEQQGRVQDMVDSVYARFVGHVAGSRRLTTEEVLAVAGGRVWSGEQALAAGLVDRIGGLRDAIARAAKDAKLEEGAYEVQHAPRPKDLFEVLAQQLMEAEASLPALLDLDDPLVRLAVQRGRLDRALDLVVDAFRPQPTRVWAMLPTVLEVR